MKLSGGMSWFNRVSFSSDTHKANATAKIDEKGEWTIKTSVKEHPGSYKLLSRLRSFPIPRLLYLITFLLVIAPWFIRVGIPALVAIMIIRATFFSSTVLTVTIPTTFWSTCLPYIPRILMFAVWLQLFRSIAPWHGAEHMVASAYWETGSTDIKEIRKHSRIDKHCGARFYIVFVLVLEIGKFIPDLLGIPSWVIRLLMIEATLWVDHFIGLDKIPILSTLSLLLQRITTAEPSEHHIETAKSALDALIEIDSA